MPPSRPEQLKSCCSERRRGVAARLEREREELSSRLLESILAALPYATARLCYPRKSIRALRRSTASATLPLLRALPPSSLPRGCRLPTLLAATPSTFVRWRCVHSSSGSSAKGRHCPASAELRCLETVADAKASGRVGQLGRPAAPLALALTRLRECPSTASWTSAEGALCGTQQRSEVEGGLAPSSTSLGPTQLQTGSVRAAQLRGSVRRVRLDCSCLQGATLRERARRGGEPTLCTGRELRRRRTFPQTCLFSLARFHG